MNKSKLALLVLLFIAIVVGVIYISLDATPSKISVRLFLLENTEIQNSSNKIVETIFDEILISDPTEIDLYVFSVSSATPNKIELKIKPNEPEKMWKNRVKISLDTLLSNLEPTELSNQITNEVILKMLQLIKDNKDKEGNYFVLTGAFPVCYDAESADSLISKIEDNFININSNNVLLWSVIDMREHEETILNSIINKKIAKIIDRRIILEKSRECIEHNASRVYSIFFDKLDGEKIQMFEQFLMKRFGDKVILTIWNDGPINNTNVLVNKENSLNNTNGQIYEKLVPGRWTSVGFLFKQATNYIGQLPDSVEKPLILVGNFPINNSKKDIDQLDEEFWKAIKSYKNFRIVCYRPSYFKPNIVDKAFVNALREIGLGYLIIEGE